MVQPRKQNVPIMHGKAIFVGLTPGKRPRDGPRTTWCDYISDLAWCLLDGEQTTIREYLTQQRISSPDRANAPRLSGREKMWVLFANEKFDITYRVDFVGMQRMFYQIHSSLTLDSPSKISTQSMHFWLRGSFSTDIAENEIETFWKRNGSSKQP